MAEFKYENLTVETFREFIEQLEKSIPEKPRRKIYINKEFVASMNDEQFLSFMASDYFTALGGAEAIDYIDERYEKLTNPKLEITIREDSNLYLVKDFFRDYKIKIENPKGVFITDGF